MFRILIYNNDIRMMRGIDIISNAINCIGSTWDTLVLIFDKV